MSETPTTPPTHATAHEAALVTRGQKPASAADTSGVAPGTKAHQGNDASHAMVTELPETHTPAKSRTLGWKIFDAGTYLGVNFGGNVLTSFWIANKLYDKTKLGIPFSGAAKMLKPFYEFGRFLEGKVFGPVFHWALPHNKAEGLAGLFSGILALSWGGTSLVVPVKWLEDNKRTIVRSIDNGLDSIRGVFGSKPTEQELEERKETYKLLDSEAVHKTWGQAFRARAFGLFVGAFGGLGLFTVIDPKGKGIERLADVYRNRISPWLRRVMPEGNWRSVLAPETAEGIYAIEAAAHRAMPLPEELQTALKALGIGKSEMPFVAEQLVSHQLQTQNGGTFDATQRLFDAANPDHLEALRNLRTATREQIDAIRGLAPTPDAPAAAGTLRAIHADNKRAWNVSNINIELLGSGVTAAFFYVKIMFKELFGKKTPEATAPAAPAVTETRRDATTAGLAANALNTQPEIAGTRDDLRSAPNTHTTKTPAPMAKNYAESIRTQREHAAAQEPALV